jgi:hypothetical protein
MGYAIFKLVVSFYWLYTDRMKNKATHWIALSILSIANATVWFYFIQQIDILANH